MLRATDVLINPQSPWGTVVSSIHQVLESLHQEAAAKQQLCQEGKSKRLPRALVIRGLIKFGVENAVI